MINEDDLSLEDLCEQVSLHLTRHGLLDAQQDGRVSPAPDARTIRYYATLGLVDRPKIVDRQARYGRRHVAQLLAIKALQRSFLPLAEIQARLYGRSTEELEGLVDSLPGTRTAIRSVLWREVTIEPGLKLQAEHGWSGPSDLELLSCTIFAPREESPRTTLGTAARPEDPETRRRGDVPGSPDLRVPSSVAGGARAVSLLERIRAALAALALDSASGPAGPAASGSAPQGGATPCQGLGNTNGGTK